MIHQNWPQIYVNFFLDSRGCFYEASTLESLYITGELVRFAVKFFYLELSFSVLFSHYQVTFIWLNE